MATENADNIKLKEAVEEVSKLSPKDKVRIHNKYYATVNTRNHIFRKHFGTDASYVSRVEFRDPIFHNDKMIFAGSVVATTELWIKKNMIAVLTKAKKAYIGELKVEMLSAKSGFDFSE